MKCGWLPQASLLALAASALASVGCSRAQPLASDVRRPTTWQDEVALSLSQSCNSCHSGATPAAGYDTTTYLSAIGEGRPGKPPVAVAGDASSLILQTVDPAKADATHAAIVKLADVSTLLTAWVVPSRLAYARGTVHEGGILNPQDPAFHGALLRQHKYDFGFCQSCHGADFSGGTSGVSCNQCHTEPGGPTACTTCHGQPPESGAHQAHAKGFTLQRKFDCAECHHKPATFDTPGHLLDVNGQLKEFAAVDFGALAQTATAQRIGPPAWDRSLASCSSVYCHGGAFTDTKAGNTHPNWTAGAGQASCGSCHGLPPQNHATTLECRSCHGAVIGEHNAFIAPQLHVDGKVDLGDGRGTCTSCHGSSSSPAPPKDVLGNTDSSVVTVGAHQAHLTVPRGLSVPVTCDTCHVVPAAVDSPGHIDHPGPAIVTFSGLALKDSAAPVWDRTVPGCSATYCHGGGAKLVNDKAAGRVSAPVWTGGTGQAQCGGCHGIPPSINHSQSLHIQDCAGCHFRTVDAKGNIVFTGPPEARVTTHINGVVDVF